MIFLFALVSAVAPGLFWLWFVYSKDRYEPEPKKLIAKAFFVGMAVTVPAILLELLFHVNDYITIVAGAPVIEELMKFLGVYLFFFRKKDFNEPVDGIVYSAAVALGFATLENTGYVLSAMLGGEFVTVSVMRALLSVPGHFLFSTVWGYGLGVVKFRKKKKNFLAYTLLAAMALHGAFNFLVTNLSWVALLFIFFTAFIWAIFFKNIKESVAASPFRRKNATGRDD